MTNHLTVADEHHILKKFKGRPPSLIVHLHPTNFRFDQQDGSFSYHSEMRLFIEHLDKGTIPHDMVEEFKEAGVHFYDGWLIVKVVDHRTVSNTAASSTTGTDSEKPFSIHNYNQYITPSPYAPYPIKAQPSQRSPPTKQEGKEKGSERPVEHVAETTSSKPLPKVFHCALRPTNLSRHMDMVCDAMAPDPRSLNRKQSQANVNGKGSSAAAPQTPISGVPSTPSTEKGPPLKKQKMKIDAKDLLEYESRVINSTAPPLLLDPAHSAEEAEDILRMLTDPHHNAQPPSPKSRKRTIAEVAADDAQAKNQERFMLFGDERSTGTTAGANAAQVDGQAGTFQPRFEKFNALETIKRTFQERKQHEQDRQLREDENRRELQQRQAEEDRRRQTQRLKEQREARLRQEQHEAHQLALQQQAAQQNRQQAQQQARANQQPQQQASGIPPQVQSQMMANQQRSSPVIRQGTPHAMSSPVVNNAQGPQGAGSPARPGSAVQHGHPMARNQSNSGQSRHGTPQMPNATPGMRNATPVMRQGTPGQHMTQASPHGSMMAPTPQMTHAATMAGQIPNGMTQQQMHELQRRQAQARMQQIQQQQQLMQQQNPQMAHNMAQQAAMAQRQAAMQHQQSMQQQQMGQGAAQTPNQYKQQVAEQMKAQMQHLNGNHASPVQGQMNPQQQAAMVHQQQQQQMLQQQQQQQRQGQMMGNMQQQQLRNNPAVAQFYQQTLQKYQTQLMANLAPRYGGNPSAIPPAEIQKLQVQAQQYAQTEVRMRQQKMAQQHQQQAAMRQQQGMANGMNMMNPNVATMQQQQAHNMQGMQMAHAQQMMQQQQQQQQQQQNNQNPMFSMQPRQG
jgi:transcription factor SPT20